MRFWKWERRQSLENKDTISNMSTTEQKVKYWSSSDILDLQRVGLREAKSKSDLQGFKIIRGKGQIYGNLATLRMVARAYGTPCPVDVLEKTLEGAVERAGSVPIHGMGQLAEAMGLQTQVGSVGLDKLNRVELPVLIQWQGHYALITEVSRERILLADPEMGWVNLTLEEAKKNWGNEVQLVLLKRLDDTPNKKFGWGWFLPVIKRFHIITIICI